MDGKRHNNTRCLCQKIQTGVAFLKKKTNKTGESLCKIKLMLQFLDRGNDY